MTTLHGFAETCRRDRNVAFATLGVSFWTLATAAFFAGNALLGP